MADESQEKAGDEAGKSSGILGKLIRVGIVILVFAIAGVLTYAFVLAPMFQEPPAVSDPDEHPDNLIPADAVAFDFPEKMVAVQGDTAGEPSAVLQYTVSVICANETTRQLVEANRQWFESKFDQLHRGKTKSELNDTEVVSEITEQARNEADAILRRLQEHPDTEVSIIKVLHLKFAMFDL